MCDNPALGGPGLNAGGGGVLLPALVLEISPSSAAVEMMDSTTSCLACLVSTFFAGGIGTNLFSVRFSPSSPSSSSLATFEDLSSFCLFLRIAKSFKDIFIFTLGDMEGCRSSCSGDSGGSSASSSKVGGGGGGGGGGGDGGGGGGGIDGKGGCGACSSGISSSSGGGGDGDLGVGSMGAGGQAGMGEIRESWAKDEEGEVVDEPVQYQSLAALNTKSNAPSTSISTSKHPRAFASRKTSNSRCIHFFRILGGIQSSHKGSGGSGGRS